MCRRPVASYPRPNARAAHKVAVSRPARLLLGVYPSALTEGYTGTDAGVTKGVTQGVTLREAARTLGISKEAVRKRVKRGTLDHETGVDGRVYVYLPVGGGAGTDAGGSEDAENPHSYADYSEPKDDRDERIAELQETVRDLRERLDRAEETIREHLDHAEEANRENRRIIAGLIERLPSQLEPPQDEPGAAETYAEGSEGASRSGTAGAQEAAQDEKTEQYDNVILPKPETARRPWWRRIFGG